MHNLAPVNDSGGAKNAAAEDTPAPVTDVSLADLGELMGSDDVSAAVSQLGTGELEATWPEPEQDDGDEDHDEEEAN